MHARSFLPLQGTLLRWGGLLILMLVLVVGLLGMHVIGGVQAGPMMPTHVSSSSVGGTAGPVVAAAPVAAHSSSSSFEAKTLSAADHAEGSALPGHQGSTAVCGCSPSGCDASMAGHGACIPVAGSATPAAPAPGLVPDPAAGPTETDHATPKPADLFSHAPSLTQLCISRT